MIVVSAKNSSALAARIAKELGCGIAGTEVSRFPDGELYVRILSALADSDVVLVGDTGSDAGIMETMLLGDAALEGRPEKITTVIPYFGYARQHRRYKDGEAISSRALCKLLDAFSDSIVTVELHNEQTVGYSSKPFMNIKIVEPIASHFAESGIGIVISPDDGGAVRASETARILGIGYACIEKKRIDAATVEMKLPDVRINGEGVLLVDDMISTGGTILKAAELLRKAGAGKIYVGAVHGLFANGSGEKISKIVDELAVTDTIESRFSTIHIARNIADVLKG